MVVDPSWRALMGWLEDPAEGTGRISSAAAMTGPSAPTLSWPGTPGR